MKHVLRLVAAGALVASSAAAQSAAKPSQTLLRVLDIYDAETLEPIVGAQVKDAFTQATVTSSKTGNVGLVAPLVVREGSSATYVDIRKVGYQPIERLLVDLTQPTRLAVPMRRTVELAPVVTTERLNLNTEPGERRGFSVRCQSKLVSCVGADELAENPARQLVDFLRRADGMLITCSGGGAHSNCNAQMRGATGGKCVPVYFVNGIEWGLKMGRGSVLEDIEQAFPLSDLEGIEVYRSEQPRPMRFEGRPGCGAIVLWTK
jgi:hypothetical protein